MELEVRQPILQNRRTFINRIPVILGRINTDVSLASFESTVRNLLLDIENTYWDLHLAYRNLETARIGRDSAQFTWKTVYEKVSGGVEGIQAEQQSKEQYFFFRAQAESAYRDLLNTEGRLRFLMGIAPTDGRLIRPIDEPTIAQVNFDWSVVHEEALIRSPELRQQKWLIQRRELEIALAKNTLLPQLDLGATYRWFGIGDHLINADRNGLNFPQVGSTAFDVLTEGDYQEAALFMQFQMPVGFRRALNNVRNSQLVFAREKARLQDMELQTTHLISSTLRNLDANRTLAQTQFLRWTTAIQEVQTAQNLLTGGKITLDVVLDSQRRRAQAQIDYYRAIVDYNKSIAEVHFRKGSLFEFNNVHLTEGPWPEKAYWDALGRARQRDASYYLDYGWSRPGVISEGPIADHWGETHAPSGRESIERIPAGRPTPSPHDQPPGKDKPQDDGRPEAPQLQLPGPITTGPDDEPLHGPQVGTGSDTPAFSWSAFDSGSTSSGTANPLRQVSHENE
jgi:outer membrane protein TolC